LRIPDPRAVGWLDGCRTSLAECGLQIDDPAFHVGLGLFETIAVRNGALLDLTAHLDRLRSSGRRIRIPLPPDDALGRVALEAGAAERASAGWLKIVCTRRGRWMVFSGAMDAADEGRSVSAVLLRWRRNPHDPLSGMKTLNHAASVVGLEQARRSDADEGVWLNTRGHLAEACTSNLFVVDRGKLFTPGVRDGILPGVVRGLVLRAARDCGIPCHEGKLRLPRLHRADEAFLTSSLCGLRPLVRFAGRAVGTGRPGAATRRLAARVDRLRERTRAGEQRDLQAKRGDTANARNAAKRGDR